MSWKSIAESLPRLGDRVEIKTGNDPNRPFVTCGTLMGTINGVVGVPELGEPWLIKENLYVTEWRLMQ